MAINLLADLMGALPGKPKIPGYVSQRDGRIFHPLPEPFRSIWAIRLFKPPSESM